MNTVKTNLMNAFVSAGFMENPDEILEAKEFDDRFIFMCEYLVGNVETHYRAGEFFKETLTKPADFAGFPFSESLLKEEVKQDFDRYSK